MPGLNAITRELKFIYRYYLNTLGGPLQLVVVLVFILIVLRSYFVVGA